MSRQFLCFIIATAIFSGGCSTGNETAGAKEILTEKMITPLLDTQCRHTLNEWREWQLASLMMAKQRKQQWEDKICHCVSKNAPGQMSAAETVQMINPTTRDQAIMQIALKTLNVCWMQLMP